MLEIVVLSYICHCTLETAIWFVLGKLFVRNNLFTVTPEPELLTNVSLVYDLIKLVTHTSVLAATVWLISENYLLKTRVKMSHLQ